MKLALHVSRNGNDNWNGYLPSQNAHGTDGPLATLDEARKRARSLREQNIACAEVTVRVAPGRYEVVRPLSFSVLDSDLRFVAEGEGEVVVDGSIRVKGWEPGEINGRACWVADLSRLLATCDPPRSLFVNGERRPRSRFPREGWLDIEAVPDTPDPFHLFDGAVRFVAAKGDVDEAGVNRQDIEAVVNHLWIEERMPVADYDPHNRLLTSTHRSVFTLRNHEWMADTPCARYFLENVREALCEPGSWYLDRATQQLYYLPREGEEIHRCDIRLAVCRQLVRLHGSARNGEIVRNIHFEGFTFAHTDWTPSRGWGKWWDPETSPSQWRDKDSFKHFNDNNLQDTLLRKGMPMASSPQAAHDLPGAVSLEGAERCSFTDCTFRGLGFYGMDVREGCRDLRVQGCQFVDVGGGGIKVDGADVYGDSRLRTGHVYIGDNTFRRCGRVFPAAVGIAILNSDRNLVEHNDICDQFYSGISVGWVWGFGANVARDNLIQYNHVHDIGQGRLSDMGGIYTLGVQPGTVLRGNHIHHVQGSHYGGWGIYLDEGSSFILVEQNLVHHTHSQGLHEHWGRQNRYQDNVFALAGCEALRLHREEREGHVAFPAPGATLLRNILLMDGEAMFLDTTTYYDADTLTSDLNLIWDRARRGQAVLWNYDPSSDLGFTAKEIGFNETRAGGRESHSLQQDPGFIDPDTGDFTLAADSPAHELGIQVLDVARCGPRPPKDRGPVATASFHT